MLDVLYRLSCAESLKGWSSLVWPLFCISWVILYGIKLKRVVILVNSCVTYLCVMLWVTGLTASEMA